MAQIGHFVFCFFFADKCKMLKLKNQTDIFRQETISNIFKNQTKIKAGVAKSSIQKLFPFFTFFTK